MVGEELGGGEELGCRHGPRSRSPGREKKMKRVKRISREKVERAKQLGRML